MSQTRDRSRSSRSFPLYREWREPGPLDPLLVDRLRLEARVLPEVARVLLRRSDGDLQKTRSIREPSAEIPDVFLLPGLGDAAGRIAQAVSRGERIVVYSDFDADGVTCAALLFEALTFVGASGASVYLPSRFTEGYGFHASSVRDIASAGRCLFITSDCGITAADGCAEAARLGCQVIVTDHHLPGNVLPDAHSLLDPYLPSWVPFDLRDLTGAGVAYLLAQALFRTAGAQKKVPERWGHDLLALSIAGDGYPVLGLNRSWVASGVSELAGSKRPGITALLEAAGIRRSGGEALQADAGVCPRPLSFDRDVVFGLVPRLNAAGRLKDARLALDLLLETDSGKAKALAAELNLLNQERKGIEDSIMAQCLADLEGSGDDSYAVCACRPEWHEGVIGIAASKLRETFGRPAALAGGSGDLLKGSVRGIPGFNVVKALSQCSDLLAGYGGHEAAGGFSVRRDSANEFFERFSSVSDALLAGVPIAPALELDEVLALENVSHETLRGFLALEPFGRGNAVPQASCVDCEVEEVSLIGKSREHLQITLTKAGASRKFLWFGRGKDAREIALLGRADVAFTPYRSVYLGEEQVTPLIKDIRPSRSRSGAGYSDLVEAVFSGKSDAPAVVYTWSPDAAESIWAAARNLGRTAAVHFGGQTRVQSHEARLTLNRSGGIVISTAPWELLRDTSSANCRAPYVVMLAHLPVTSCQAGFLLGFLADCKSPFRIWKDWEKDSLNWLFRTYPEKDSVSSVWKFLKKQSAGCRVAYAALACRYDDLWAGHPSLSGCPGSFEGIRLLFEKSLSVLQELGMVKHDDSKRVPEMVLSGGGERVCLAASPSYAEGKAVREGARETWRAACAQLLDRRSD